MNGLERARVLFDIAVLLAEDALQNEARLYLATLPFGAEVVCCMGHLDFVVLDEEAIDPDLLHPRLYSSTGAVKRFAEAQDAFEQMFDCTYGPWRFTRTGPVVTDW
jgi:hypothetical protein